MNIQSNHYLAETGRDFRQAEFIAETPLTSRKRNSART